jgi:sugar phosphate isomerase/epimerase
VSAVSPPAADRLCLHTITTKPLSLEEAIDAYVDAGVAGITVWSDALTDRNTAASGDRIRAAGLRIVSLCRGGFFVSDQASRREAAIETNRALLAQAADLGAPLVVLVCGADPAVPLPEARDQIRAGVEALIPTAEEAGVSLAIEPLHPMYADTRSAINTLAQANDLCEAIDHSRVGLAVDVYHLWWDPALEREIARCGKSIVAFHVSDWMTPTTDLLNDRGLMGEGCIPIRQIRGWVEDAGFDGAIEVEIFSDRLWQRDQRRLLPEIVTAYHDNV